MLSDDSALEVTEFTVDPGNHAAFAAAMRQALPILDRQQGALSIRFGKTVEAGETFFLIVEWRRLEDHTEGFRGSADFDAFVGYFRGLLRGPARVTHVAPAVSGRG